LFLLCILNSTILHVLCLYSVIQRNGNFKCNIGTLLGTEKFELYVNFEKGNRNFIVYQKLLTLKTPDFNKMEQPRSLSNFDGNSDCSITELSPKMLTLIGYPDSPVYPFLRGTFKEYSLQYLLPYYSRSQ